MIVINGTSVIKTGLPDGTWLMLYGGAKTYLPMPCPYCKRVEQVTGRKTCDGCGANRG